MGDNGIAYTPGGLAWGNAWGPLRFTTNAAMIASVYSKNVAGMSYLTNPRPLHGCHQ